MRTVRTSALIVSALRHPCAGRQKTVTLGDPPRLRAAQEVQEATPELVELIGGDWEGRAGHERGRRIVNMVIDHWEKYAPVLRARNNASDEGNLSLREERMAALMPLVHAFREAIERSHARADAEAVASNGSGAASDDDWQGGRVSPLVGATAISSCLERLSMYHAWIAEMDGTREELVETTATPRPTSWPPTCCAPATSTR